MLEFTVSEKLGGLKAIISDDLKTAGIEGIGEKVNISWANKRPNYPAVNYIEPYGKTEIENLNKILKKKGFTKEIKPKEIVKIAFTDEQKQILYAELKRQHQQFFDDLMLGKIPVREDEVWCWQNYESGKGWYNVRPMTRFEVKAYQYLQKFFPVYKGIRM